jgi:hypothetical protein
MSKFNTSVLASALAAVLVLTLSVAPSAGRGGGRGGGGGHGGGGFHGGGFHGGGFHGGGRHFSARSSGVRSHARPGRSNRSLARRSAPNNARLDSNRSSAINRNGAARATVSGNGPRARAVHNALTSGSFNRSLHNAGALHNPANRALLTAGAATAGLHGREGGRGREGRNGWWRHRNGGYGWVGPLFWPFAYYDIYGYAMWGYGYDDSFWNYGYNDIYAGIFGPYGYDALAGYLPQAAGGAATNPGSPAGAPKDASALAQMCGQDSRDIAGLPIDAFQQAIQPTDEQRSALDDLANASVEAAQDLKAACPTEIALTAPNRLAAMQQRIEAMIAAVKTVQPPLEKLYGLLDDEQKARLTALGQQTAGTVNTTSAPAEANCGDSQAGLTAWPTAEIDKAVKPTDAQRDGLAALQDAAAKAGDMLKASCAPDSAITPPARLAAVGKRLDTMLQAVTTVRSALDGFYASLSDEQKADFDAISPQRAGSSDAQSAAPQGRHRHGHGEVSVERAIRNLISVIR